MATDPEPLLDLERILNTLDRHQVNYLVVGGTAANAYGATRITKDFDCLPERTSENLERLCRHAGAQGAAPRRGSDRRLRFDDLAPRAAAVELGGVAIRIADLADVIASKEWADRPKDHDALPELRAIHRRRS